MSEIGLPAGITCRPLEAGDIDDVVAIESEAFSTPWHRETFEGLLDRDAVQLIVMSDRDEGVIGYAVLWCILDQGELANLAIAPGRRGCGLGSHLLRHVMHVAALRRVQKLFLEVRMSNSGAAALYTRFGFTEVGVRRDYYDRPKEDARIMMASLEAPADA